MSEREFKASVRAAQQDYVRSIQERTGLTPTEIQREAGIKAASTLTRLMQADGDNLGAANYQRLVRRFGAPSTSGNNGEAGPAVLGHDKPLESDDSFGEAELVSLWRRLKKPQKEITFAIVEAAVKAFYSARRYGGR